jgi:hypothetical protein
MKDYKIRYTEEVVREVVLHLPEATHEDVEYKLLDMADPYPILESGKPHDVSRRIWTIDSVEEMSHD